MVGGGAKGLEFRSWCEKCLGPGVVPLPVAGGRTGCLNNGREYLDDQQGTVRVPRSLSRFSRGVSRFCTQVVYANSYSRCFLSALCGSTNWRLTCLIKWLRCQWYD